MGDDIVALRASNRPCVFLSTSPVWGTTPSAMPALYPTPNFYPRPPYGGRLQVRRGECVRVSFLSTSPVWGTTLDVVMEHTHGGISIHVPRMGDDGGSWQHFQTVEISIHVPRMGDDLRQKFDRHRAGHFYPRPPYGGRHTLPIIAAALYLFLSTSPVWGTTICNGIARQSAHISIHVPRMGDDRQHRGIAGGKQHFYPRPPYGGRPTMRPVQKRWTTYFYPRPPYGGRRGYGQHHYHHRDISIHVPRMGDDAANGFGLYPGGYFYPRPPYGGRPMFGKSMSHSMLFLSTSPVWGTTYDLSDLASVGDISIHVPRMGDDPVLYAFRRAAHISIHVPRMGDDVLRSHGRRNPGTFLSTSPVWGTTPAGGRWFSR